MPIHDADPLIAPARQDSGVTLSGLRAFVAVTEAGSFSGAARALGVTQPSVSVQLAALERACGLLLCHRKPEVVLTQAGQDLFVRARLILSRVQEFEASVVDLQQAQGRLVVGLSTPHAAMPLIAGFSARWPDISLRTVLGNTTTLLEDVSRCRLDVAVMTMMQASAQLECVLVSSPRLTVCLRADDPLARRTSLRPADLLGRDFIAREAGSQTRALFDACRASSWKWAAARPCAKPWRPVLAWACCSRMRMAKTVVWPWCRCRSAPGCPVSMWWR